MSRISYRMVFAALVVMAAALTVWGYASATATPIVRRLTVELPGYDAEMAPTRVVLVSDIHVHGPDMPPARVSTIVQQVNDLHPDVVILAGDFIGNNWIGRHYSTSQAIQPLKEIRAKLGTFAVFGNNDHIAGVSAVANALASAGVRLMNNDAVRTGPLVLGGLDDRRGKTGEQLFNNEQQTFRAMTNTQGAKILVAHGPDEFPSVPTNIRLMLAGHTHCGQIAIPFYGPIWTGTDVNRRFACGVYRDGPKALVVTGGVGTSHLPLRFGAPPDIWLIEVRGSR